MVCSVRVMDAEVVDSERTIWLVKSLEISSMNAVNPALQPATDFSSAEKHCSHLVSSDEIRLSNSAPIAAMRLGSMLATGKGRKGKWRTEKDRTAKLEITSQFRFTKCIKNSPSANRIQILYFSPPTYLGLGFMGRVLQHGSWASASGFVSADVVWFAGAGRVTVTLLD
jgi:hypothetical protein